ncbi:alpha/beta fold hydrolase [Pontixanthobacter aestiaquae]|uniref:esterase/lipase family protein n=1 Tax=Pontixanthobacter aestiaquae TaxID=1509367 RepID=UPI001F3B3C43|nr:alpha/beta fold hydrolase [Pontixanthobacter aestiaquae]MDN3644837.1 alpha/beta fold hydrolase [Pontixanthobacter aestiaquae]
MAAKQPPSPLGGLQLGKGELSRRVALAREANPEPAPRPKIRHTLAEARAVVEPALRLFRTMEIAETQSPQTVMLLPGFGTHPVRMKYMAQQIERAGHTVKRWGMGFNFGPTPENVAFLEERLVDIHERYGRDVVLVGWSLGGLFARELAKRHPGKVAKVITMGSPFSGNPRANNAWRIYQFIAGHKVDQPPIEGDVSEKPPVETIAFWSARDGIVSPRCTCGKEGERDRAVALRCNHIGFSYSPECIRAILRELGDN